MDLPTTTTQPITLTKEIKDKVQALVEGGLTLENDKAQIAEAVGIPLETLKDLYARERQERLLKKAETVSEELLDINVNDPNIKQKYPKEKIDLIKIKKDESQFLRETLGKDVGYSKRSEITGKNGEEIRIKEIIFNPPVFAKPKE